MNTAKAIWRYSIEFECPPYRGNRHTSSQHFHPDASFNSWKPRMVPRFIMLILCGSRILANLRVMLSRLSPLLELPPRNDSDSQREFNKQSTNDSKGSLTLRQTGRINDFTNAGGSPPLFQPQSTIRAIPRVYRVVLACAMMFPPIGFSGSLANTPVSGFATTWFVTTTATPNSSASFCSPLRNCAKFC